MPKCRSCNADIIWLTTENEKLMPVDAKSEKRVVRFNRNGQPIAKVVDTFTPHFATCPDADKHRKE